MSAKPIYWRHVVCGDGPTCLGAIGFVKW